MITIHQICYNEALILEFAYNFYKTRFPSAKFVLHDNQSTDGSVQIAERLGYKIESFETNGFMDDFTLLNVKNTCWLNDDTDWVIVSDMDELIDINEEALLHQERIGSNVIQTFGFQMINLTDELKLENIHSGFRDSADYDKCLIFNKRFVKNMDWSVGCHICNPTGDNILLSSNRFPLLHFKYLSEDYLISRYRELNARQSQLNIQNSWSVHYKEGEESLRQYYRNSQTKHLTRLL